ncbi:kynureninase [Sciscionella marina]|uniref:kynureninase n=1 Tax=Sciscionella marina TaxID=508770 RepID=UPI000363A9E1|nr:aminotransferase class V-fold PLP-dependent enzyme [Sciscionella marina]
MTREQALEADRADELGRFRERFLPVEDDRVIAYLDGNSLGRPPREVWERLRELVFTQWGTRMIRSWSDGWLELPQVLGDLIAESCLGARNGQTILADSTSVCLYKVLRGALALRPGRTEIVTDADNFPTDRYLVDAVAAELGLTVRCVEPERNGGVTVELLREVVSERTALVTLSHVAYRSAYIADMAGINEFVHAAGAFTVWDLCHSVGAIPVRLEESGTDFAVGCTYKFLNSGPGAPGFLYARAGLLQEFTQPITGWFGAADVFAMARDYRPAPGIRRALSGTPAVLALAGVAAGAGLTAEAGIEAIRAKSLALTGMILDAQREWLRPLGFRLVTPETDALRGGHVTLEHERGSELAQRFIEHGVIVDFRHPDGIRLGPAPLSTGFAELWDGLARIGELT